MQLGDVCEVQNGYAFDSAKFSRSKGTPLIRIRDLKTNLPSENYSGDFDKEYLVEPGDLLVGMDGEFGCYRWGGPIALLNQRVCRLFPRPSELAREFLSFTLDDYLKEIERETSFTTVKHISSRQILGVRLALPPLKEQVRIAGVIGEQMTAVERARPAAEAQLEAAKALPAAYLKEMFESAEILVWPQRRLGDLMRLRKDMVHPRERPRGRAVFVGLEHIASGTGARVDSASLEIADLSGRKPRFYEGDIVYGYLRPYLNKVWVAEFDGLCSVDQYVYAVNSHEADTRFIAAFMRSHMYLARAPVHVTRGQLPRIRTEEVASVMINLPPVVEQERLIGELEVRMAEAERMTRMAEEQVVAMNALPAALLRRAFSGEL